MTDDLEARVTALEERMDMVSGLRAAGDRDLADLGQTVRAQHLLIQALSITQSQHTSQLRVIEERTGRIEELVGRIGERTGLVEERTGRIEELVGRIGERTGLVEEQVGRIGERTGLIEERTGRIDGVVEAMRAEQVAGMSTITGMLSELIARDSRGD